MREEAAILQDLKLGPMLGRGSYGRVHRARWKSAVVAVKIIEQHKEGGSTSGGARVMNVGRESLLATAMSHPNVVQTYHISTMTVGERVALAQRLRRNKESLKESSAQQGGSTEKAVQQVRQFCVAGLLSATHLQGM
jgi:serine/threonine protein kinase